MLVETDEAYFALHRTGIKGHGRRSFKARFLGGVGE